MENKNDFKKAVTLFTLVVILVAIMSGFSSQIYTNYFKEVYNVTSVQRGFLEIPRESPGILCMFIIAALAPLGDIKSGIFAQILVAVGLTAMAFFSPSYSAMMLFLFIASSGQHIFMPLNDSIGMSLAQDGNVGKTLGRFKTCSTVFSLLTSLAVFICFKYGIFSFKTHIIIPFAIAIVAAVIAAVLLMGMTKYIKTEPKPKTEKKHSNLVLRKEYTPYYLVTLAYGCQKRIKLVFGPWVIADLLLKGADTISLLAIGTYFIGILIAPVIGRMLDRMGARFSLIVEGIYIIIVFSAMGFLAGGFASGKFITDTPAMYAAFVVYMLCNVFDQFSTIHAYLMRSIARDASEITATLSVGLSVDHVIAIVVSAIFGIVWAEIGAQYVFYICAATAIIQIVVGLSLKNKARS